MYKANRIRLLSSSRFTPTQISGLRLWIDASRLSLSDGAAVSTWTDLSGNYSVTQGTAASRPTFRAANAINGQQSVEFDGAGDHLVTNLTDALGDFSIFVAFCPLNSSSTSRLIDKNYTTGFWVGASNAAAEEWGGGIKESGFPYGHYISTPTNSFSTLSYARRTTTKELFRNGTLVSSQTACDGAALSADALYIGSQTGGGGSYSRTHISEVLIWNFALSADQRQAVHRYLGSKWGITIV